VNHILIETANENKPFNEKKLTYNSYFFRQSLHGYRGKSANVIFALWVTLIYASVPLTMNGLVVLFKILPYTPWREA